MHKSFSINFGFACNLSYYCSQCKKMTSNQATKIAKHLPEYNGIPKSCRNATIKMSVTKILIIAVFSTIF